MLIDTEALTAERAAFDAWWAKATFANCSEWDAWQARAALAAEPSIQPEPVACEPGSAHMKFKVGQVVQKAGAPLGEVKARKQIENDAGFGFKYLVGGYWLDELELSSAAAEPPSSVHQGGRREGEYQGVAVAGAVPRSVGARPLFITFTGADEHTSIEGMRALSRQYPIEWGVLFSPSRQGQGRYPPLHFVARLIRADGLLLSAHLCGGHSRDVIERGASEIDPFIADGFERAQINSAMPQIDPMAIARWGAALDTRPILQCRGSFPASTKVAWLFDKSGGKGIVPETWPPPHPTQISGYAGGIGPDNVLDVLAKIEATDFWIDMESGVRDSNDRFSLAACRAVCEAVYGPAPTASGLVRERAELMNREGSAGSGQLSTSMGAAAQSHLTERAGSSPEAVDGGRG